MREVNVRLRRQQVEAWALEILDMVKGNEKVEDSSVELKSNFIEPTRAARRIAGHANAARGEPILWIIGLDEEYGISQVDSTDLAEWWPKVTACFAGLAPVMVDYVLSTEEGPLVLLFFDTSASPYVVKNPAYGAQGGGPVQREVPWRDGTRIRSAGREDLVRLLVPLMRLPHVELLDGWIHVDRASTRNPVGDIERSEYMDGELEWKIGLQLYITPAGKEPVVLPIHRTHLSFRIHEGRTGDTPPADTPDEWHATHIDYESGSNSTFVFVTGSEAIITLPGTVFVEGSIVEPFRHVSLDKDVRLTFSVKPTGSVNEVRKSVSLTRQKHGSAYRHWTLEAPLSFS